MATSEMAELAAAARVALAAGRIQDALACFASAAAAARVAMDPADPARIALAAEHAQVWFDHRSDPTAALEIATVAYEEAVYVIDDAGEHRAAVRELAVLRDQMTFWAFRMAD